MEGDVKRSRKLLKFKIRWAGYGPDDDTWEPWDNCKNSSVVQDFLRRHPDRNVRRLAKIARQDIAIET
jgi:DNA (cytosine-5)-methyltransferase 1